MFGLFKNNNTPAKPKTEYAKIDVPVFTIKDMNIMKNNLLSHCVHSYDEYFAERNKYMGEVLLEQKLK